MADDDSALSTAIKQLENIWDWLAFGAGCIAGAFAHTHLHDAEGYSIPALGIAAVTFRQAVVGLWRRPSLRKKYDALKQLMSALPESYEELSNQLDSYHELWGSKISTDDQFEKDLDSIVDSYKEIRVQNAKVPTRVPLVNMETGRRIKDDL